MLDIDNIISLLRDAIEEEDWRIVEQVLEILSIEIDNPRGNQPLKTVRKSATV